MFSWRQKLFLIFLLALNLKIFSQIKEVSSVSFGPVNLGEARIPIQIDDFKILIKGDSSKISAKILPNSLQWVRLTDSNILTPRARVAVLIDLPSNSTHLRYSDQPILLQEKLSSQTSYTELYISLFQPDHIQVIHEGKNIAEIYLVQHRLSTAKNSHLIDYSCAPYHLEISGLDKEYISIGCRTHEINSGSITKPLVEVYWTSAHYTLLDGSSPPYLINFLDTNQASMKVINTLTGEIKKIQISAKLPHRLFRLTSQIGLGHYPFDAKFNSLSLKGKSGPSLLLKAKFAMIPTTYLQLFDLHVQNSTMFNNGGLYLNYELGRAMDNRLTVYTLFGFQSILYKFQNQDLYTQVFYPQGIELKYDHVFGIKNLSLYTGLFFSTSDKIEYTNLWVRFGEKIQVEFNYVDWEQENKGFRSFGASVNFPLLSLF